MIDSFSLQKLHSKMQKKGLSQNISHLEAMVFAYTTGGGFPPWELQGPMAQKSIFMYYSPIAILW